MESGLGNWHGIWDSFNIRQTLPLTYLAIIIIIINGGILSPAYSHHIHYWQIPTMVGFCHGGNLLGNHDHDDDDNDDHQKTTKANIMGRHPGLRTLSRIAGRLLKIIKMIIYEYDHYHPYCRVLHDYPANSHHDKNPPWREFVSNEYGGNMPVTKSHHW